MAEGRGFLSNIPWWGQLAIMVVLVVAVWYLTDQLMFANTRIETDRKMQDVEKLKAENADLNRFQIQLADYKKAYDQAIEELKVYRERLPEEVKISETLQQLQEIAKRDTLVIRSFDPKGVGSKDFYKEKPVEIKVGSTYANLGRFFEDIANFKRIVQVSKVEIGKAKPQTSNLTIESSFTITTFFASEDDVMKVPETKPAK